MHSKPIIRVLWAAGLTITGLAAAGSPGCEKDRSADLHTYIRDEISDLKNADVPKEVDAAVARGDYRFVGVNSRGIAAPGIDDADMKLVREHYGLRMIENTTDSPRTAQERELQTIAWGYALEYNKLLKRKLPVGK